MGRPEYKHQFHQLRPYHYRGRKPYHHVQRSRGFLMAKSRRGLGPRLLLLIFLPFLLAACQSKTESIKTNPTFAEDIAPIIFKNCAPCHRPGEAGPFPLLTYDDVLKKAKTIAAVTEARYMPPWPADPSYSHFRDERVLTDAEIQLIQNWVMKGSPAGDPGMTP